MVMSALLIAEHRARWELWAQSWCGVGRQLIILMQPPLESAQQFRERIGACLDSLNERHCRLHQVMISIAPSRGIGTSHPAAEIQELVRSRAGYSSSTKILMVDPSIATLLGA
jgi:hypothetical protein